MLIGPRAVGKTTTAARYARTVVRLDRPREAEAVRTDPDAVLRGLAEPVLLDEWQLVPEVLAAVKRFVDADPRPGRYIITGSARGRLQGATWPGTGRVVNVAMFGMTVREQIGMIGGSSFLDRLSSGEDIQPRGDTQPDLRDYVGLALGGGFPEPALRLAAEARTRWLRGYVDQLTTRDAEQVEGGRDPVRLARFLEAFALNSAGVVEDKTLYDAAGISRMTAVAYERLLANLFVTDALPAWTSNRLKRLVLSPKRYLVDPALIGAILRLDAEAILRDADMLGPLLDTFVVAQIRAEVETSSSRPRLFHVRQQQGRHEIDLLAELGGRRVVGMEVKTGGAPRAGDARHLVWMRDLMGERFVHGVLFHTGPRAYRLDERISAIPICALWS